MNQIDHKSLNDAAILRRAETFLLLEEICQDLDWSETQFQKAKTSYEAVGNWISGSDDPLLASTLIYLHGSGALGTSTKPIGHDEFDVDLICFAEGIGKETAPAELKASVGQRLKEHGTYAGILEEKKRCWRLNYAGDFHLDISPTIANPHCYMGGELVPDRKLRRWHPTNPRGYRELFDRRAELRPRLTHALRALKRDQASVDPFPEQKAVKGILRRLVQLLKRHRDHHFLNVNEEIAPISIIITTLAMQAYEYCVSKHVFADELEVLVETIRMMPHFIERPVMDGDQIFAIWNETTTGENFAERWNSEPARVMAFYEWHAKALADFEAIRDAVGLDTIVGKMQLQFGDRVVNRVLASRTEAISSARKSNGLFVAPSIGLTTTSSAGAAPVLKNDFFGD
ncbi:MAG TPA: nucleotidyltransferase [Devosiaceae bacterium]